LSTETNGIRYTPARQFNDMKALLGVIVMLALVGGVLILQEPLVVAVLFVALIGGLGWAHWHFRDYGKDWQH